jgi:hypothetical protein
MDIALENFKPKRICRGCTLEREHPVLWAEVLKGRPRYSFETIAEYLDLRGFEITKHQLRDHLVNHVEGR